MQIALIGKGKTGGEVLKLAQAQGLRVDIFDSQRRPSARELAKSQVAISFVAGDIFLELIPVLLEANIPVVSGATGLTLSSSLHAELQKRQCAWVWGSNFSLGMRIVHHMIKALAQAPRLMPDGKFHVSETHHIHKKDSPSGTALSWRSWLGPAHAQTPIEAFRQGDVVGDHTLTFETAQELIEMRHHAKTRALFAQGALWTAQQMHKQKPQPGLYLFEQFADERLKDVYAQA